MARPQPLADLVQSCLGRALAAQGFAAADVVVAWPEIVGERLASVSQPLRMEWKRSRSTRGDSEPESGSRPAGTLVVRVEGAFALELQHLAPVVVERVNAYYGWRCVERLALKQGPVRRSPRRVVPVRSLSEDDRRRIGAATGGVEDAALRGALQDLGAAVLGSRAPSRPEA